MSGSFVAWRITDAASTFLVKGPQPILVDACCDLISGRQDAEEYCRRRKLPTATFELWVRDLVCPKDLRNRGKIRGNCARKSCKKQGRKWQPKKRKRPLRHRFGARTDDGPVALRAFWSMHVER